MVSLAATICAKTFWHDATQALPNARTGFTFSLLPFVCFSFIFYLSIICNNYDYIITQKRDRQPTFFQPQLPEAFTAPITAAKVVFSRSRSKASCADAKTLSKVS